MWHVFDNSNSSLIHIGTSCICVVLSPFGKISRSRDLFPRCHFFGHTWLSQLLPLMVDEQKIAHGFSVSNSH